MGVKRRTRSLAYARGLAVAGDHEDGADGSVLRNEAGGASTVSLSAVIFPHRLGRNVPSGQD